MTLFVGFELLSIPLYVLCATRAAAADLARGRAQVPRGRARSGSATLLYGLALIYGATGRDRVRRDREGARQRNGERLTDPLLLSGIALCATGLAFKASVAPFHQWTPDVYQGAPTPITTFMAVATKAAAFGVSSCGCSTTRFGLAAARLGAGARGARGGDDRDRQRRRDAAALAQADARLVERRAGRLPAGRRRGRHPARRCGRRCSTSPSTC